MEKGGQQRTSRMKMHIEAAAAAGTDDDDQPLEDDDDVKKKRAIVGGGGGSGGKRSSSGGSVGAAARRCQTENCTADLVAAKQYHRRHRVCEYHAKAAAAVVGGVLQRFCQQCSRFHELSEFDETRRSCRRRLAGHNERRRKNSSGESHGDGLGDKGPQLVCGEVDDLGKIHIAIPQDNAVNYKHFNIR